MTNHTVINKTNYFRVTDEEKYKKLFGMLTAEDTIHDFTEIDENYDIWHAFSCCAPIDFHKALYDDNGNLIENGLGITNYDFTEWTRMLQKILDERDTFIFYGPEYWTVISKHFSKSSNIDFEAKRLAEELLDDEEELIYRRNVMKKKTNNHAAVPVKIDELKKHYPEIASSLESAENSTELNSRGIQFMKNNMLLYPTIKDYVLMRMQKRKEAFIKQWQEEFETLPEFVLNAPNEEDIEKAEKAFETTRSSYSFWLEGEQPNKIRAMFTDGDAVVSVRLLTTSTIMSLFEEFSPVETVYYECVNHAFATYSIYS